MCKINIRAIGDGEGMDISIRVDGVDATKGRIIDKELNTEDDMDACDLLDVLLYLITNGMMFNIHLN